MIGNSMNSDTSPNRFIHSRNGGKVVSREPQFKFRYVFEQIFVQGAAGNSISTRHHLNFAFSKTLSAFSFRCYDKSLTAQMC